MSGPVTGVREVEAVRARVVRLCGRLDEIGKGEAPITLAPKDYALLVKRQGAAGAAGFNFQDGKLLTFGRHALVRGAGPEASKGAKR